VPFLWVIPLALYLLTFVLVFAERPLFPRWLMLHVQLVLGLALIVALCLGAGRGILGPAVLHLTAFFATAMMCHRELADSRPRVEYLTEFYLWMSLGGVLGGVFNVLLAPVLYDSLVEYPFALVIAFGLRPGVARSYGTRLDFIRDLLCGRPGASIRVVREAGATYEQAAAELGVSRTPVRELLKCTSKDAA